MSRCDFAKVQDIDNEVLMIQQEIDKLNEQKLRIMDGYYTSSQQTEFENNNESALAQKSTIFQPIIPTARCIILPNKEHRNISVYTDQIPLGLLLFLCTSLLDR